MSGSWRRTIPLALGIIILCSWCSLISGVGGWVMGYDLGKHQTEAALLPETGVLVTRVERGSPAAQSGIERGDTIIALNGAPIEDVTMLHDELKSYTPGEQVTITYLNNTSEHETSVVLSQSPGGSLPYMGIYYTARAESPADI